MELELAKQIGRHLAVESKVDDPESHLPWAFAHALGNLPGPPGKEGVWLAADEIAASWLTDDGECVGALFKVVGEVEMNDEHPTRPIAKVKVESRPLTPGRWMVAVESTYGAVKHGYGYRNTWTFRYRDEESTTIGSERMWDGDEEWPDDLEIFARLFANKIGWAVTSPP